MLHLTHDVAATTTDIYVPETLADYREAESWVAARPRTVLALDTETTGLEVYSAGYEVRTVQVGDADTAWVLRTGRVEGGDDVIRGILSGHGRFVAHSAPFDILSLARVGLADLDDMLAKTYDTYILAHLLDPRSHGEDGAVGLSLKALSSVYVDPDAADPQQVLKDTFRALGAKRLADGWALPALTDDENYLRYAGLDVILTSRLLAEIGPLVRGMGMTRLASWEHDIQRATTRMTHRGIRVDVSYIETFIADLRAEAEHYRKIASRYGVDNVNSVAQVRDSLLAMGVDLTERTATGNLSVGKEVLLPLAGLTPYWSPIEGAPVNPLAEAVVKAKRADKWRVAYAEAFLAGRDENDRIHPNIKSLAARTGRMSVSSPALQQLPSGDWRVRRCLIADPGKVFISSDFAQVELRVLAANANVRNMHKAIEAGESLHVSTAKLIWGEDYSKKQYGVAKSVNFLKVYGGGATRLAKTAGISAADAREVFDAFDAAYPEVRRYGNKLQRDASQDGWAVRTAVGRRLPLSRERSYAATNFSVQSTARDLFAAALLRVSALPGGDECLSLVVHDEILSQVPIEEADRMARLLAETMSQDYLGVPIDTESEVLWGGSWGSGYGIPADRDARPEEHSNTPLTYSTGTQGGQP